MGDQVIKYEPIEALLNDQQRNYIAYLGFKNFGRRIDKMCIVNVYGMSSKIQDGAAEFLCQNDIEKHGIFKVRGGGEDSIYVPANKDQGETISCKDYDGHDKINELVYMSQICADGGATGKGGVEGASIEAAFGSKLNVSRLANVSNKGGAGGGKGKNANKFAAIGFFAIKGGVSELLSGKWRVSKEEYMKGKSIQELLGDDDGQPLFTVRKRATEFPISHTN
jgi:hypothetical protein